jgi:hypothetical protein
MTPPESQPEHDPASALHQLSDLPADEPLLPGDPNPTTDEADVASDGLAEPAEDVPIAGPTADHNDDADSALHQHDLPSRQYVRPKVREGTDTRWLAAGAFGIIGLLLLLPGFWSLNVILKSPEALEAMAEQQRRSAGQVRGMAYMMLVAWPIALFLLTMAWLRLTGAMKAAAAKKARLQPHA